MDDDQLPDGVTVVRIAPGSVRTAVNKQAASRLHDQVVA
jgi:hypothetical protein